MVMQLYMKKKIFPVVHFPFHIEHTKDIYIVNLRKLMRYLKVKGEASSVIKSKLLYLFID